MTLRDIAQGKAGPARAERKAPAFPVQTTGAQKPRRALRASGRENDLSYSSGPSAHIKVLGSSWELAEEADVVLEEERQFGDAVFHHGEAVDTHAEGEAGQFFRVVFHEAVDGRIHHPRAE